MQAFRCKHCTSRYKSFKISLLRRSLWVFCRTISFLLFSYSSSFPLFLTLHMLAFVKHPRENGGHKKCAIKWQEKVSLYNLFMKLVGIIFVTNNNYKEGKFKLMHSLKCKNLKLVEKRVDLTIGSRKKSFIGTSATTRFDFGGLDWRVNNRGLQR